MTHHPVRNALEMAAPFAVVAASYGIAEIHAVAGLALTCLGIVYTGRKLWLSFKNPSDTRADD